MKSIVDKVIEFNQAILGITQATSIAELSHANFELLVRQLDEELLELQAGWEDTNIVNQVDALVDLIYFALGGLYKKGLSAKQIEHVFGLVHDANMTKGIGKVAKRNVEGAIDAVKPMDFQGPELSIREYLNV
jgi:predicted HAD superfamily Cof-like phosphohydrolase